MLLVKPLSKKKKKIAPTPNQAQKLDGNKKQKSVVVAYSASTGGGKADGVSKVVEVSNSNSVAGNTRGSSLVISNG